MISFLSWTNSTLYDGLPYAFVTLSFVLTLKYIRFPDVTCAGAFVSGAAASAVTAVNYSWSPVASFSAAFLAGCMAGLVTAILFLVFRIERLVAGIISAFILYTINMSVLRPTIPYGGNDTILSGVIALDRSIQFATLPWFPYTIALMAGILLALKVMLDVLLESEFGLALRALEDDQAGESILQRLGHTPAYYQTFALVLGNGIIAVAGALVSVKEGAANVHRGFDVLITGLIAYYVGVQMAAWPRFLSLLRPNRIVSTFARPFLLLAQLRASTLAILGALIYFGLVSLSYRVNVSAELTKLILGLYVAVSIADYPRLIERFRLVSRAFSERNASKSLKQATVPSEPRTLDSIVIRTVALGHSYTDNGPQVFANFDLSVRAGEHVRLAGGNGAGKSTLLKLLAGALSAPKEGDILICGRDLTHSPHIRRRRIVYMEQESRSSVVSTFTVEQNLALSAISLVPSVWRRSLPRDRRHAIKDLLTEFGLEAVGKRLATELSGGQRQLLNFLTLLMRPQPRALLLDEPFNNLDSKNVERCIQIVRKALGNGTAVILVSHSDIPSISFDKTVCLENLGGRP